MKKIFQIYIGSLFLTARFYLIGSAIAALFFLRYFVPAIGIFPILLLWIFVMLLIIEYSILFTGKKYTAIRTHASRLSNGDDNEVQLFLENRHTVTIAVTVYDELPYQFQKRDATFHANIKPQENALFSYMLHPVQRGIYAFGYINSYIACLAQLLQRRYKTGKPSEVSVYPSYLQLRKYQILALNHHLQDTGLKKQRKYGQSFELEQIKEYIVGDDYRAINWKATSRHQQLMVNNYTEEKSQSIYCVIDKGRLMEMPFDGLSLLDYAINASLVLSSIALYKEDKAGILTFEKKSQQLLPADRKSGQMHRIQELLYRQQTQYEESSFEHLYIAIKRQVKQRSLLVLFTNFVTVEGLRRQLPYLRKIAENHLMLVVFFQNTILENIIDQHVESTKDIYTQAVAEEFYLEKNLIVKELQRNGILSLLSLPQQLTVNSINRYLEIKNRGII